MNGDVMGLCLVAAFLGMQKVSVLMTNYRHTYFIVHAI